MMICLEILIYYECSSVSNTFTVYQSFNFRKMKNLFMVSARFCEINYILQVLLYVADGIEGVEVINKQVLTWHDAAPGLIFRQDQFAQPAPWPRPQETDVIGDLHQAACQNVEGAVHLYQSIMSCQGLKLVGCCSEWKT